jgi:hypothetical protein
VDGTLLEAWAGAKSFKRKDGKCEPPEEGGSNPTVNFHGEKRSNETHASTTDADARLAKKGKGKEAKLSYTGHVLMVGRAENQDYKIVEECGSGWGHEDTIFGA